MTTPPPGSREAAQALDEIERAIKALLCRDERNTCQHDETTRGGTIWEICSMCGAKWADDEGGKPEWQEPNEWGMAHKALSLLPTLRAALAPPADGAGEVEADIRAVYAAVRAARTACVPTAPESVWQAKDEAEGNWDSLTNYLNPNGAVPTLLRLLSEERARRVEVEGALAEIARCNQYMSEADTNYEYEMRQIELCRFIKTRARATHKDTQDE